MKRNEDLIVGIDCGGTNMKMAVIASTGEILSAKIAPIRYDQSPEKVIQKMAQNLKDFLKGSKFKKVRGVGIGIAGDTDQTQGIIRFSPNLNWKNVPFQRIFSHWIELPVLLDNDANCAAWGAYVLDAKKDCRNLICLTLGTGIGGGLILNSKLYRGATGSAGEIGHMTIQYQGHPCACGSFGCAESFIGSGGLIRSAEEGLKKGLAPVLQKLVGRSPKTTIEPKLLSLAAEKGDPYCQQLWKDAGEQLGVVLANCVNIFNPERIVLCGGVSKAGNLILEPALHTLGRRAFAIPAQTVKVTISQYDEKLGVVGAGLLFLEESHHY